MKTITIDTAISYVWGLFTNEPDFSYLTYYFHRQDNNNLTYTLFLEDIKGDWDYEEI